MERDPAKAPITSLQTLHFSAAVAGLGILLYLILDVVTPVWVLSLEYSPMEFSLVKTYFCCPNTA